MKIHIFRGDLTDVSAIREALPAGGARARHQCFFYGRNTGQVTPKIMYFNYLKTYRPDQSIQKIVCLFLKTEALPATPGCIHDCNQFAFIRYWCPSISRTTIGQTLDNPDDVWATDPAYSTEMALFHPDSR